MTNRASIRTSSMRKPPIIQHFVAKSPQMRNKALDEFENNTLVYIEVERKTCRMLK